MAGADVNLPGHNSFVTDLLGLFVPNSLHWLGGIPLVNRLNGMFTGNPWETVSYLGLAAIVVVIIAFRHSIRPVAPYLLGGFAFLLMAMGINPHFAGVIIPARLPDQVLSQLPFLANLRCPVRFMSYVYLFWSIIVVLAVQRLVRSGASARNRMALMIILPALLVVDYSIVCTNTTEVSLPKCYDSIKADTTNFGILELPEGYDESCRYMMYQTLHGIPIVNGAITRKIGRSLIDTLNVTNLEIQNRQLVASQVKYIVVHKDFLSANPIRLDAYLREYIKICEYDGNIVFQLH